MSRVGEMADLPQVLGRFEFASAGKIIFGEGTLTEIGREAAQWGQKALVSAGSSKRGIDRLSAILTESGVTPVVFHNSGEPSLTVVLDAVRTAREAGCDMVIAFGGGSAIDAGKAAAALMTNPGDPLDYLEVVGRGKSLQNPPAPFLAVPTSAGTGSEVTRNAVITVPEEQVKVSLRSPMMLARAAVVDPELTYSLPPDVTASTGMDALAQLIEPYVSRRANPFTDMICREGIALAARSLKRVYHDGGDRAARADMSLASCLSGLALANAGLGAVHGLAGPLGGMFHAPHGAICAALLPAVVRVNSLVLEDTQPQHPALGRYAAMADWLAGAHAVTGTEQKINALADWLDALRVELKIPGLREFGVSQANLEILAEKGAAASSTRANPVDLNSRHLRRILETAM